MINERQLAGKWFGWEECLRVPLIIHDPRTNALKGVELEQTALNIDLAPTIAELAGIAVPAIYQGRSLVPLLTGESPLWRQEFFFEHYFLASGGTLIPRNQGVRTENWKYVHFVLDDYEQLYDLRNDPGEVANLAYNATYSNTITQLRHASTAYSELYDQWPQNPTSVTDNDVDGLPDTWEVQYLQTLFRLPGEDDDLDGYLNGHEYVAGTDPKNAASRFRVEQTVPEDGDVPVSWESVSNRVYVVHKASTLSGSTTWSPISEELVGDGQRIEFRDQASAMQSNAYYHVEVGLSPHR